MPGYDPNIQDEEQLVTAPEDTPQPKKHRFLPMLKSLAMGPLANMGPNDTIQSRLAPIIQGFVAGAATPNVAHGGGTDVFRAAQAGMNEPIRRQQIQAQLNAQLAQTRQHNAQADWMDQRPVIEGTKDATRRRGQDFTKDTADQNRDLKETLFGAGEQGKMERLGQQEAGRSGRAAASGAIKGALGGYDVAFPDVGKPGGTGIVPMARPVIKPMATDALSQQARANVENKQAGTSLVQAKTEAVPQLTAIRKMIASADLMKARSLQDQVALAQNKYNWEYNGVDDKGNAVYSDPETGEKIIPKLMMSSGMKLGATEKNKANQAQLVQDASNKLLGSIKKNAGKMGPLMGRGMNWQQVMETLDPEASVLLARKDILSTLLPATHGLRGTQAVKKFDTLLGSPAQHPESMAAIVKEISDMAGDIVSVNRTPVLPRMPKSRNSSTPASQTPHPAAALVDELLGNASPAH